MDPRTLVANLQTPYPEFNSTGVQVRDVLLAGLRWPTEYWPSLAIAWIEQGAPIDSEIATELDELSEREGFPQQLRHKAFSISHRWARNVPSV